MTRVDRIARYWNGLADVYDESGLLAGGTYPSIVRKLQGELWSRDRLLEIGAGTGMLTIHVAPLVDSVTCTDVAPEMLEKARAKLASFEHVDYRLEDATGLSFDDHSFDVLLCCNVLHQMAQPDLAVREFLRVLRPGGCVTGDHDHAMGEMTLPAKVCTGIRYFFHFGIPPAMHPFKLHTFTQLIASGGFDIVEATLITRESFPTAYVSAVKPRAAGSG